MTSPLSNPAIVEPSLLNFIRVIFRHKKKVAGFVLLCTTASLLLVVYLPRSYRSEAKVYLRIGRESISLDPTATTGQTVMMEKSQESEINSVLEVLHSRQIAAGVVDRLGTAAVLESDVKKNPVAQWFSDTRSQIGGMLESMSRDDSTTADPDSDVDLPTADEEQAMRLFGERLEVHAPKNSTVVTIAYEAASPGLARAITQATVDVFVDTHVRLNRTEGSFEFFVEQTAELKAQLQAAENALQDRKIAYGIVTVEGKRTRLEEKLQNIELARLEADRQLARAEARINELKTAADALDKEVVTESVSGYANTARDRMREQLYAFEIREKGLIQTYTASHPLVIAAQEQRKALEAILNEQPSERTQTTSGLNPTRQMLELDLEREEVAAMGSASLRDLLASQMAAVQTELVALNSHEVELASLQRNVDLAQANYRVYAEKLEQARIDEALEEDQISNVNVVQPPSYIRKPASPKKLLVLAGGLIFGIVGGVTFALIAETLDASLRTAEQTEAHLGLPVLLSLPPEGLRSDSGGELRGTPHGSS